MHLINQNEEKYYMYLYITENHYLLSIYEVFLNNSIKIIFIKILFLIKDDL